MSYDGKITIALFSDEDPDRFNEDLSTDEEGSTQKARFTILQSGSNIEKRALIDRNGFKFTEKDYGRNYVSMTS